MPCDFKSRRDDILFNIFKNISLIIINFNPIAPEASGRICLKISYISTILRPGVYTDEGSGTLL